ncbi:MAG TPA: Gfo/Idh/MocA family oxidoreductase [Firmicutes bacterium]|nr:Gfo/Idh/MocA family oxidoreductase [Bacillota bacterium]HHY97439.1 Gfo/Idh/MocA family oxidoreductase [Bacillota bacterium]
MYRVGVIGAGTMGRVHAGCYKRIRDAELVWIADIDAEKASSLADSLGARATANPMGVVEDASIDIIDVCLPTYLHKEWVIKAARAGKHVFCEKPIALTLEDAEDMIRTCERESVKFSVGHVLRFFPEYEMLRESVASGELGQIAVARFGRGGPFPRGWQDWYRDISKSAGMLVDLSIHDFDFVRWCFGDVERIYTQSIFTAAPLQYALTTLRLKSGAIAHVEGSWAHPGGFWYKFEVAGKTGMMNFDSRASAPISLSRAISQAGPGGVAVPESPLEEKNPYLAELANFVGYIKGESQPRVTPQDAFEALRISLSAVKSAEAGKVINL